MKYSILESCNVLLCLTYEQVCKSLHQFFSQEKANRVVYAHDNGEATRKMTEQSFDLFVIDSDFPSFGGIELSQFIRLGDGNMAEAPIIMFMHEPSRTKVISAINAGINEIIVPPFSVTSLKRHLDHLSSNPRPFVRTNNYSGPVRVGTNDINYASP